MARLTRNTLKNTKNNTQFSNGQQIRLIPETRSLEPAVKTDLHSRSKHRGRYDFAQLIVASPLLAQFVKQNAYHDASIDFSNPQAVKALNQALLKQFYNISVWDIPAHYLCPPIPSRADYVHYMADLLAAANNGMIPQGETVHVLDVGVGANIIYPLVAHHEYGWHFVGADIDPTAIENGLKILEANSLASAIELRLQVSPLAIFSGIVERDELFDLTICNPPFHGSLDEANTGSLRKWRNLGKDKNKSEGKQKTPVLNFGGQAAELYCDGGEAAFVTRMVQESAQFATQCLWFTTLVSKAASLPSVYRALKQVNAQQVKTIEMSQGQKKSRIVAWTFLNTNQQAAWYSHKAI